MKNAQVNANSKTASNRRLWAQAEKKAIRHLLGSSLWVEAEQAVKTEKANLAKQRAHDKSQKAEGKN